MRPLSLRVALLVAAGTLVAGPAASGVTRPPAAVPERRVATEPKSNVTRLPSGLLLERSPGGGVSVYNPFLGTMVASTATPDEEDPEYDDGTGSEPATRVWGGKFDSRLTGKLRSKFYRPTVPANGPGRVEAVAGGACDGATGPEVAIDPATVRVDKAGRVFWLDENANAHFKGLPYVRVLDLDGRVRTLGNIGGPMEGRHWRDGGTASGMARIIPDDKGGVYFDYVGYFSIGFRGFWSNVADDLPRTTVIGRLKADGTNEFVSGRFDGSFQPSGNYQTLAPNGDGGPAEDASFNWIYAMTADPAGNLYVVDGNPPAGTGTGAGAPTNARSSSGRPAPEGHVESKPVVVRFLNRSAEDVTFYAGTPQELTVRAGTAATIAGRPPQGGAIITPPPAEADRDDARKGELLSSPGIVVDEAGNVLLLQIGEGNVKVLAVNTGAAERAVLGVRVKPGRFAPVAGTQMGYGGDGGKAVQALFDVRQGNQWWYGDLALDGAGGVVIADTVNNRVRRIDRAGIVTTIVGNGTSAFNGDGKAGTGTALAYPMGVAVARDGDVLVADWLNARIRSLDADTGIVSTLVGNGSPMGCGDGRPGRTGSGYLEGAGLGQPHDAVEDSQGNVYIADIGLGVVRKVAPDGTVSTVVGTPFACTSAPPSGQGYLASCPPGDPSGDGGPPQRAVLQQPGWLLVDRYDNLYISDGGSVRYVNFRSTALTVHEVRVEPGTIATVYEGEFEIRKSLVTLVPGGDPVELTVLVGLGGIALDEAGTLYVADVLRNRVWSKNWCGDVEPVAGNGTHSALLGRENDANGDGGPAVAATVSPVTLAWDGERGLLFVTDLGQARVRVVNMNGIAADLPGGVTKPGFIETFAGGAQCSGSNESCAYGDGRPATEAAFMAPYGISARPGGRVFVTDGMAAMVRAIEPDGTIGTLAGVTPQTAETDVVSAFMYWYGGICGEGGISHRACVAGGVAAQVTPGGDLLVTHGGGARVQRVVDAVRAPLRPLVEAPPLRGAGWRFTTPLRLTEPAGLHAMNPTLGVDATGHAFVYATRMDDDLGGAGCAMWRVDIDKYGTGTDAAVSLGTPGNYTGLGSVSDPLFGLATETPSGCSVAVAPAGASDLVPPPGAGQRISYATAATTDIRTGASRATDGTFVPSPAGAVTGALLARRAWVTPLDADTFGMGVCCVSASGEAGKAIVYATSSGGVQYVLRSTVATETPEVLFTDPVTEPVAVTRGGQQAVVMPYATMECTEGLAECNANTSRRDARLRVARSTDGGATWQTGEPVFSIMCFGSDGRRVGSDYCQGYHGSPQVAADAKGTLYATFDDQRHVYVAHSTDLGATWSEPRRVDTGLTVAAYPTLVAGVGGAVDVAFLGTTSAAADTAARDAEWYVYLAQSLDAGAARPAWTQSVADQRPVHYNQLAQGIHYASYGDFLRIAVDPRDGRAIVAYQEDRGAAGHDSPSGIVVARQCTGTGILGPRKAVPCAPAALPDADPPAVETACPDQVADAAGDAPVPSLDVRTAGIAYDSGDLVARLSVADLSLTPPTGSGGQAWTVFWETERARYFLRAEAGPDAAASDRQVAYSYGTLTAGGALSKAGAASGSLSGDTLTMWAPGRSLGGPPAPAYAIRALTETAERGTPLTVGVVTQSAWERADAGTATRGYAASLACAAVPHVAPPPLAPRATAPAAPVAPVAVPAVPVPVPVSVPSAVPAPVAAPAGAPVEVAATLAGPAAPEPVASPAPAPVPAPVRAPVRKPAPKPVAAVPAPPVAAPAAVAPAGPAAVHPGTKAPARAALPALLPCSSRPPEIPPEPRPAQQPKPNPEPQPGPRPPQQDVPRAPIGQPVAPPEPPVQPVGPNPAGAPAPQPQPQVQQQPGAQQQVSSQTQPGQQAGMAGAQEAERREARAFAASRRGGVSPALVAWGWTAVALAAGGSVARARRKRAYAYARVRGR